MLLLRGNVRYLCTAAAVAAWFVPAAVRAQGLPEGPGLEVVQKACGTCHPTAQVVGRHLSREEWSAQVTKMVAEGAKLTDAEFTQVVNYLARSFPPDPAAAPAARGRGNRGGGGPQPMVSPGRGGSAGGAGPADMQVIDQIAADRGRTVYIAECVMCHGPKARGANDSVVDARRGSDLVRSITVLHDRLGKEIGPFLAKGHPMQSGKPSNSLSEAQILDLSHFLHQKVAVDQQ
jgi:mono/diheme cytochrome c family protein